MGGRDRLRDVLSATLAEYLDLTASIEHPTFATFGRLRQPAWPDTKWTVSHELLLAHVTGQKPPS